MDVDNRATVESFIKENNPTDIRIELRDLKEVLDDVVLNDMVEYDLRKTKGGYTLEIKNFVSDRLRQKIDEYNQKKGLSDTRDLFSDNDEEPVAEKPKKKAKF